MAISTNGAIITRLAGALYNEYLSNASYLEVSTTAPATVAANFLSNDFAGKTDAQLATTILTNLGLTTVAGLDNWVAAQLTAAGTTAAAKGAALVGMLNSYANMTADATYGTYATSFNAKVAASLTASQTDGAAGGSFSTSDAVVVTNQNITLTSGVDYFVGEDGGGAGNDSFLALSDGDLDSGDVIEGGEGTDSLLSRHTIEAATTIAPSTTSVEILKVRLDHDGGAADAVTYSMSDVVGVTEVQSYRSVNSVASAAHDAVLNFTGTGMTTGVTLAIVGGDAGDDGLAIDITATYASVTGTADSSNLRLDGAGANVVTIASIETLNITSTTGDKTVSTTGASAINSLVATSAKTVNINSAGTTTLEATDFAAIVTIDASASAGAVRVDLDDSSAVTFIGGAGNDRIDVHAITTLTVDDQLDGGAGSADVLATSATSLDTAAKAALARDTVNFERLEFDSSSSVTVDMADVAVFNTVSFTTATTAAVGSGAGTTTESAGVTGADGKTITGIEAGDAIIITAAVTGGAGESITSRTAAVDAGDGGNAIVLTAELDSGSNSATITFSADITGGAGGAHVTPGATAASGGDGGDAIYAAEFETVNLITAQNSTSSLTTLALTGGAGGDAGVTATTDDGLAGYSVVISTNGTINVSGAAIALNLGTISGTNATVNASTYTGTITLVMEAGANTFIGGSNKDTVTGAGGLDTYTLGDGNDSVVIGIGASGSGSDASAAGTSFESITDFTKSGDVLRFLDSSDAALTPTIATDSTATAANAAVDAEGIASFASADDTLAERLIAVEAAMGGTAGQMAVFEHGGNTYVFVADGTAGVDAGDAIVKLVGVTGVTGTTIDSSGYVTLQ
jgi:hypothetical protein